MSLLVVLSLSHIDAKKGSVIFLASLEKECVINLIT